MQLYPGGPHIGPMNLAIWDGNQTGLFKHTETAEPVTSGTYLDKCSFDLMYPLCIVQQIGSIECGLSNTTSIQYNHVSAINSAIIDTISTYLHNLVFPKPLHLYNH